MKKNMIIGSLMFLVMAMSVFAVGDIVDPAAATITYNDLDATFDVSFDLENTGAADLTLNGSSFSGFEGTNFNLTSAMFSDDLAANFVLTVGNTVTVVLTVDLTNTNAFAESYNGIFRYTTTDDAHYGEFDLTIDLTDERPNLAVTTGDMSIIQGYDNLMTLTLANTGNTDVTIDDMDNVAFSYADNSTTAVAAFPVNFNLTDVNSLDYGVSATFNITLIAENTLDNTTDPADYNMTYDIEFDSGSTNSSAITFTVVAANPAYEVLLAPNAFTLVRGVITSDMFSVTLNNLGNVPLTNLVVDVSDFMGTSSNLSHTPTTFTVASLAVGATSTATDITVSIPTTDNTTGTQTFTANVDVGTVYESDAVDANGTYTVTVEAAAPSLSVTPSPIDFGSVDRNSTVTKTFTVTNNGNIPLSNLVLTPSNNFNLTLNNSNLGSLAVNAALDVTATAVISKTADTGFTSFGTLTLTSDQVNATNTFTATIGSKLLLEDLDVKVGSTNDNNLQDKADGYKIDADTEPEDEVKFTLKLENLYTDDEDLDIDDIELTITIKDIDDGDDLDDETTIDLKAEDTETVTMTFDVPLLVDEGDYTVLIEAEGEDENGVKHSFTKTLILVVDKEKHKLTFNKKNLNPSTVRCDRTAILSFEVTNIGTKDEDEVRITATNPTLGLDFEVDELELDEGVDDAQYDRSLTIAVPEDLAAGSYPITLKAYYDEDILETQETVTLVVEACTATSTPVAADDDEVVVVTTPPTTTFTPTTTTTSDATGSATAVPATVESSFFGSTGYLIMLVLANLAVVGIGILIITKLFLVKP